MADRSTSTLVWAGALIGALAISYVAGATEPGGPPLLRLRSAAATGSEVAGEDGELAVFHVSPDAFSAVRARLAADGVRVLAYLPEDALLVERALLPDSAMAGVVATEPWRAERAITPELASLDQPRARLFPGGVPVLVGLARAEGLDELADRLGGLGARVSWIDPTAAVPQLGLLADPDRLPGLLDALRATGGLVWADLQPPLRLTNGDAAWRCQSGVEGATPLFDNGLDGQGQVVGIMDTGIDIDHCMFWDALAELPALNGAQGVTVDPDHRKVLAVDFYWSQDWPNPGPFDWDSHGHGSHVAGSVAGDAGADGVHQGVDGMAPAARLVIQDGGYAVDDCADLPGLGCPVRPLEPVLQQAYDQGARLHSNSWGDEENFLPHNRYTERAVDVDRFVWEHPEMTVLFAAGNAGADGEDSVISPATAKNVIAAGATWRADFIPPCPTEWSSRGFAHDGRIKPDVMAPGAGVISAETDFVVGNTQNCDYVPMSGTSMATPVTAGHAALVRQYFVEGFYPGGAPDPGAGFAPSAALVKAMLIASAVDLAELGCALVEPVPSRDQGWGIIQLDRVLLFEGADSRLLVDDEWSAFDSAGDPPLERELTVGMPGPLKVVLVWTDPPSTSLAAVNLVNDLDLVVEGPDGTLLGNHLVEGVSEPGGGADRLNNVEVVWLPQATPGEWAIEVRPHAIHEAGQGFALVVLSPALAPEVRRVRGRLAPGP